MAEGAGTLRRLLARPDVVRLIGAHDALGAKMAERAGFQGVWASGFEIAASHAVPDASTAACPAFGRRMCDAILGPRTGPAAILYNAVDTDRFVPAAADPAPGELRVLLGGTQYREYRLRRALETFSLVARERPEARLFVTGRLKWQPDPAPAGRQAEAWCCELGIAGRSPRTAASPPQTSPGPSRSAPGRETR